MRLGILGGVGWAAGQPAQEAALEIGDHMMNGARGESSDMIKRIGVKNVGYLHLRSRSE